MSSALSHEPRSANSEDRTALQDWIILLAIAMMVASDYKFRRRGLADSLGGTIDMAILFELAIYGIAGVVLVASHIKYGQRTRASGLMAALWVYGTILAISAVYAPFPSLAMVRGGQLILIIALTQVLADRAEPGQFRILCRVYVGLMIASIAIGIAYVAPTSSYQAGRFTWLHTHTVTAASMLAIGLIISVGLLTDRPPQRRSPVQSMALVASILAIGVALLMTQ
ncbi:MAG TPA: hypothetical protein VL068_11695, partial [Microthrixaceae bacterium]|nr:hypothetical protein [Microthrixaceae bacterium]